MSDNSKDDFDRASIPMEIRNHRLHQQKLDYFLIGAAGASIAFAIQVTANEAWSQRMILWLVAVTMWGLSIGCGILRQMWIDKFLYNNISLLKIEQGTDEYAEFPMEERVLFKSQAVAYLNKTSRSFARFAKLQHIFLVVGIFFFLAWHVVSMIMLAE